MKYVIPKLIKLVITSFLLCSFSLANNPHNLNLVYDLDFPFTLNNKDNVRFIYNPLKNKDILVLKSDSHFKFYEFQNENLILINSIASPINSENINWVTGDVDNDSYDDILIYKNKQIYILTGKEQSFKEKIFNTSLLIADLLIGDINNDSINEIIMFGFEDSKMQGSLKYHLCLYKIMDNRLINVWTDKGSKGYGKSDGSANLICISDVKNLSKNFLLLSTRQSDVSPSRYHLLRYQNNDLSLENSFIISDKKLILKGHIEKFPYIIGNYLPLKIANDQYFIATQIINGYKFEKVLLKIKNNEVNIYDLHPSEISNCKTSNMFYVNLDGKSKGLLTIKNEKVKYYCFDKNLK